MRAGQRARRVRQGYWFPLVVFGALVAGATPFYLLNIPAEGNGTSNVAIAPAAPLFLGGGSFFDSGRAASIYWLIALTAGYVAVVFYYRLRALRTGVAGRIWPYAAVGLGLLALLLIAGPITPIPRVLGLSGLQVNDMTVRGLIPLVVIAIGLLVLARSERSVMLTWFALCYLALALVANLYDLGNLDDFPGPGAADYDNVPDLLVPAAFLLLGGAAFFIVQAWQAHKARQAARSSQDPQTGEN